MPDNKTLMDQVHDFRLEIKLLRDELARARQVIDNFTATAHRLHGEVEDYKAANEELRLKLAIAQAEVDGYVKRHDADRRIITELGERMRRLAYGND